MSNPVGMCDVIAFGFKLGTGKILLRSYHFAAAELLSPQAITTTLVSLSLWAMTEDMCKAN
jgi:hypothetical protein